MSVINFYKDFIDLEKILNHENTIKPIDWSGYIQSGEERIFSSLSFPKSASTLCKKDDYFGSVVFTSLNRLFHTIVDPFVIKDNNTTPVLPSSDPYNNITFTEFSTYGWLDFSDSSKTETTKLKNFITGCFIDVEKSGMMEKTVPSSYFTNGKVALVSIYSPLSDITNTYEYVYFFTHLSDSDEFGKYFILEEVGTSTVTVNVMPIATASYKISEFLSVNMGIPLTENIFRVNRCESSEKIKVKFNGRSPFYISNNVWENSKFYSSFVQLSNPSNPLYIVFAGDVAPTNLLLTPPQRDFFIPAPYTPPPPIKGGNLNGIPLLIIIVSVIIGIAGIIFIFIHGSANSKKSSYMPSNTVVYGTEQKLPPPIYTLQQPSFPSYATTTTVPAISNNFNSVSRVRGGVGQLLPNNNINTSSSVSRRREGVLSLQLPAVTTTASVPYSLNPPSKIIV